MVIIYLSEVFKDIDGFPFRLKCYHNFFFNGWLSSTFSFIISKHVTFVEFQLKHRRTCNSEDNVSCEMLTYFYSFFVHDKVVNKEKRSFCWMTSLLTCLVVPRCRHYPCKATICIKNDRYIKVNKRRMMSSTSFQLFKKGVYCNSTLLKVVTISIFIQIINTQLEHV